MNHYTPHIRFELTDDYITGCWNYPHLFLGHLAGKDKLTMLHSQWIHYMWDDNLDRALQAHRGSYKTTAMAIGIVRWMLFNPDDRIAVVRKTFTDAAEVVDMVKQIMEQPEIQEVFKYAHGFYPKARVKREGKLRYNFKFTQTPEGNVTAHGLDASLTGKHYDKIWLDDVITLKDRISKAERDRTKEVIREIRTNIIDPGKPTMFTGTPWHRDDGWNVILKDESGKIILECLKYTIDDCGLLSPEEIALKRKYTTSFLFNANYNLKITSEEDHIFTDPVYGQWDYQVRNPKAHLDAAYDGEHTCALTLMAQRPDGKYQAKGWVYPGNVKDWLGMVYKYCQMYRVKEIYNETNPDKGYTADALKKLGLIVHEYPETQNKQVKISTHGYEVWPDIVWDEGTDPEYMNQILDWVYGQEPDDAPDSMASLYKYGYKGSGIFNMALSQI